MFITVRRSFYLSSLVISLITAYPAIAADAPISSALQLKEVRLFLSGAELKNTASVVLPAGESEVVFTQVANDINPQSLFITTNDNITIQSINTHAISPDVKNYPASLQQLSQQITQVEQAQAAANIQLEVIDEQLIQLKDRRMWGNDSGKQSLESATQLLEYIKNRMTTLLSDKNNVQAKLLADEGRLAKLRSQYERELRKLRHTNNTIVVKLYSQEAATTDVTVSYLTRDAGWTPSYDIRGSDLNSPLKITYKADIFQHTGMDWNNVHLTLSSANPNVSSSVPTLNPWYLDLQDSKAKPSGADLAISTANDKAYLSKQHVIQGIVKTPAANIDNASVNNSGINITYNIAPEYSLPSSTDRRLLILKQADLKASYGYVAMPKLSESAYLQASVKDWIPLNLLAGKASVYFANSYTGQQLIDPKKIDDELTLSMGQDKGIQISREIDFKLKTRPKLIGSQMVERFAYNTKVKNTRPDKVNITVSDRLPISQDSHVTVSDIHIGKGQNDIKTGLVTWNLSLEPGKSISLPLSFSVKYPQEYSVIGL